MKTIRMHDTGVAVEDVQQRLVVAGFLDENGVDGTFGPATATAVREFCRAAGLSETDEVDSKVWAALVDASFTLGDRTLYLRLPHFHGADVAELQQALSALGFACGPVDGIFGAYTELALRKFQMNLGLPSDGIAGAYTYTAINNLHHSWEGKEAVRSAAYQGFARASEALETHSICLFGTEPFTRSVASRMSNLSLATNPFSKVASAESLLVAPEQDMILIHIVLPGHQVTDRVPCISFDPHDTLPVRLQTALRVSMAHEPARIAIELPGETWEEAGEERSAQHFAIFLLDALCSALTM